MSYDVMLFKTETMQRHQQSGDEGFFENEANFEPFTSEQRQQLKERLIRYQYKLTAEGNTTWDFTHTECKVTVLFTPTALYFNSAFDDDSLFEVGMTASEFTDTGEFKKYDPQHGGWEEL